ncbi:hypothetical protein ACFB49_18830 [Sphingomonas sp. DBB INV C78]|uniref:hypothetical protein n=1 Tax=Sphingomonas sp. DBB INV C78 TaxID=3349434 RepID=UPI0036D2B775
MAILNFLNFGISARIGPWSVRFRLDGRRPSTYVKRLAIPGSSLQLLLFLSALLSGLTGVISGDRVAAPSSLERASAEAAVAAEELAEAVAQASLVPFVRPAPIMMASAPHFAVAAAPLADIRRISERRLE